MSVPHAPGASGGVPSVPRAFRTESDALGELAVPADAYWGVHTARALENFQVSGVPVAAHPPLVHALAAVKHAAALANREIGALEPHKADAIASACRAIAAGRHHGEFRVDVIQGGAGTSTNMNANEVIANLALEELGHERGRYDMLSPLDDVNRCQSTNDTYPTALRIAVSTSLDGLLAELALLSAAFTAKGTEFAEVVKVGRTQLQDAVPMTLGQEFAAFGTTVAEDTDRLRETLPLLAEVNLGATAIGTGVTAAPGYAEAAVRHLRALTGLDLRPAADLVEATSDTGVFLHVSGVLKRAAVKLSKICNDLRLLSSGPQHGFAEICLPPRQAGSSVMPGKVNPVIPELVNQIAYAAAGADVAITMAVENGQLQLNAFEPLIGHLLLTTVEWLTRGCHALRTRCVDGITANTEHLARRAAGSVGAVTALTPYIGYAAAAAIAKRALATGEPVADLVAAAGLLDRDRAIALMWPSAAGG
ncbi:aspartate ammonia-lyase [Streptomyces paludis]|uniref:Aspartate ammonia-lyase n=1 Tax=Streptomyces paludis TaxID=2282738 RepID=A0A345HYU1_9ACTN|nr:aspartate ammonia-lyase [Streptomyces paludis]AXG81865.1 aspartate ammonia-lyase [Streptomyces paludis]